MIFETERLIIRPWKESDAESLYKYAKDDRVGPIAGWQPHKSVEDSLEIIKNVLSADETYAVCLKENNKAIGSIGLIPPAQSHTSITDKEIELGYWIGVDFWGKGLIPEAIRKIQDYAFNDLGYNAIWCGYYDGNEKSKRCQEKCGFSYHHTEENKPCVLMGDLRTEHFTRLTKEDWLKMNNSDNAVIYIHGKGGNTLEAEHYKSFFPDSFVYGFDYKSVNPWDARQEFQKELERLSTKYKKITLIAVSIGAYFSMNAGLDNYISKAYFISPIANMEKLIKDMILWAGVTEKELEEKKIIPTAFGEDLSWEYLQYVRSNKISWNTPTDVLYGSTDNLQSLDTIKEFVSNSNSTLTIMDGGEHWFHTAEQMDFLDKWLNSKI
ncbi:MAG: GNAT family N-acetyltransferase [Clostridiales bacterium]|nr:GNAT family N-acetyltransferase [Clostridiales bacterium]